MKRFFCAAVIGSALALTVPASFAGAQAPAAAEARTTQLPFLPPIATPIRYRITISKSGGETSPPPVSMAYTYRFDRKEDGYRLTVAAENADLGDFGKLPLSPAMREKLSTLMKLPLVVDVSGDAEIQGIENGDEYVGAFSGWIDTLAAELEKNPDAGQKALAKPIVDMLRSVPREAWTERLLENVQPVLEFAGTELAQGEPFSTEIEAEGPGGQPLTQRISFTLEGVTGASAEITLRSDTDPEQLAAAFRPMMAQIKAAIPDSGEADPFGDFVGITQQVRGSYRVATADGLLDSLRSEEIMEMTGSRGKQTRVTTKTIERIK
jgi:hypothetical protein